MLNLSSAQTGFRSTKLQARRDLKIRQTENGTWHVYLHRNTHSTQSIRLEEAVLAQRVPEDPVVLELDVRGLEPPEPMMRILEAIGKLPANALLLVHHHGEPVPLYEKPVHRGFEATATKVNEQYYKIMIQKKG